MSVVKSSSSELSRLVGSCGGYFATAGAFSLAINLLYLAGPLYMLQVYDRVVSSGSQTTLVMITLALLLAYLAMAGLDAARATVLTRASLRLDRRIAPRLMMALVDTRSTLPGARSQVLRDFDGFRQFISGAGIHALFDAPWAPIYIAVIFALHWSLGAFALACSLLLVALALLNERLVRTPLAQANAAAAANYGFTETSLRNVEAVRAMGMAESLLQRWNRDRDRLLERQITASDRAAIMQSVVRFLRLAMQSVILGLGAWLVIERSATGGAMFAASLLLGRALQPVEQITGSWNQIVSLKAALRRLREVLQRAPPIGPAVTLPQPSGLLSVEGLTSVTGGGTRAVLRNVTFALQPGEVLGVIGPSGAGKSTLLRHLVGALPATAGAVRLDSADIHACSPHGLGRHIGYLPQDIELFADTAAANINRFQNGDEAATVAAAQLAGVHELILRLPNGYETQVGEGGAVLSGGLRQRLGLARAVYGRPSLVVLDEPSSNLDADGDRALSDCIGELKQRGTTVVLVSHRTHTVATADKLLVLKDGAIDMFGARADVLSRLSGGPRIQSVRSA